MCDSPAEVLSDVWDTVEDFGDDVADFGQDIYQGFEDTWNSVENFGQDLWYITSGEKFRDEKELKEKASQIENLSNQMSALQDKLGNKVFLEQIFKYGDIRRIKDLGTSYEQLVKEYNELFKDYKQNTDVSFIGDVLLFLPNVAAAFIYNVLDYIKTGDSASLRTAISIGLLVATIIAAVLLSPISGGTSIGLATAALIILSSILTLDAMVNNSGLLGVAFKILDLILNKILNADKYFNTEGFDDDSQYYQSMMNNTRLVVQIAAISASLYSIYTTPAAAKSTAASRMAARNLDFNNYITTGTYAGQTTTITTASGLAGVSAKYSSFMNEVGSYSVGGVSLSDMYSAYTLANQVNDVYAATQLHNELQDKLSDAKDEMQKQINKSNRQKMQGSYSDAEYIMNQVDMSYHSYVLQMSEAGQTDVFDPEGTIVMNTRYSPKRAFMFGFEDMFQYEGMAGGDLYVYNTLWK